jgi:hypothetical protein
MKTRDKEILIMRDAGATFREISVQFGISANRASQIYKQAEKKRELISRFGPIIKNEIGSITGLLKRLDFRNINDVKKSILSGEIAPGKHGLGIIGYSRICKLANVEPPIKKEKKGPVKAIKNAIELLQNHGYKVSKCG